MLEQIQIPTEPAQTKAERLQLVADQVTNNLPMHLRMLAGSYLKSFHQVLESSTELDHNLDIACDKLRDVIDYVQHGYHSGE